MKEVIRKKLLDCGAVAVGFARAGRIDAGVDEEFQKWIGEGCHAEMSYLQRHIPLRQHTDHVLEGAKTVISLAFSYMPRSVRSPHLPSISAYAYGDDYHRVVRERLQPMVKEFQHNFGGNWRVCIDSAPIAERYWAMKAGIGKRGVNGSVIIDKGGSLCFLTEILTTLEILPDNPSEDFCHRCGECINVCPGKAIKGDGTIDSRKCLNYLTIEKKGEFSEEDISLIKAGAGSLFGCDKCLRVCPHNKINRDNPYPNSSGEFEDPAISTLPQFRMDPRIETLTPEFIMQLTESEFNTLFSSSPLAYGGYTRLRRIASLLLTSSEASGESTDI